MLFPRPPRLALLIAICLPCLGAAETAPLIPEFTPVTWIPSAASALEKAGVAVNGIAATDATTESRIGDTVTLLVQATEEKQVRQWAVVLSINDIKPEEKKLRSPALTLYSNSGHKIEFSSGPFAGMLIHVLGP